MFYFTLLHTYVKGLAVLGWVHNIFAYVALQLEVHMHVK